MSVAISKYHLDRHRSQQTRLNSQLKKRLKYSGVYYQRNIQQFYPNLSVLEQRKLLDRLELIYSQILFDYFSSQDNIDNLIDRFVEEAFFVDLPFNKVVEIHVNLIDNLERQLLLEGLHTEHLSDFRLTLIDVVAHLGEMYRNLVSEN